MCVHSRIFYRSTWVGIGTLLWWAGCQKFTEPNLSLLLYNTRTVLLAGDTNVLQNFILANNILYLLLFHIKTKLYSAILIISTNVIFDI